MLKEKKSELEEGTLECEIKSKEVKEKDEG